MARESPGWNEGLLVSTVTTTSRTAIRQRPEGWPIMHQTWDKLLFLHWAVAAEPLRRLIPAELEIDTWEGNAWIGVTPFTIPRMSPPRLPAVPLLGASHELNVRTYVHHEGVPGVWFFSLDASNPLAVWAARLGFFLPYFHANMKLEAKGRRIEFRSLRTDARAESEAAPAAFQAAWRVGERLPEAEPGTRDFFLIERYCLYASSGDGLFRARIHHRPWPLASAEVERLSSNVVASDGMPEPQQVPLAHALAEPLEVEIWPPKRIG